MYIIIIKVLILVHIMLQTKPSTGRGGQVVVPKVSGSSSGTLRKKLILTDGWQVPLTGICIYMFRLNIGKQLPEEGFHKVWQNVKSFRIANSSIHRVLEDL